MKSVDIRRNDTVRVISGDYSGNEGRVLRVFPSEGKVLVEHVMMVKKHVRANPARQIKGGIAEQEGKIDVSNVQLICPNCGPVRVGHDRQGGRSSRICRRCKTQLGK